MKKSLFTILFATSSLAAGTEKISERIEGILSDASRKRGEAVSKANGEYRADVATTFEFADRVDVFLLDFSIGKDAAYAPKVGDEVFPIQPYGKETKILKTFKVALKDIPKWRAAVTKFITSDKLGGAVLCHYPIHGLRIYAQDQLLFETSLCWLCGNYYFSYEDRSNWLGLTEDSADIKRLLDEFMPIPKSELERLPDAKPPQK